MISLVSIPFELSPGNPQNVAIGDRAQLRWIAWIDTAVALLSLEIQKILLLAGCMQDSSTCYRTSTLYCTAFTEVSMRWKLEIGIESFLSHHSHTAQELAFASGLGLLQRLPSLSLAPPSHRLQGLLSARCTVQEKATIEEEYFTLVVLPLACSLVIKRAQPPNLGKAVVDYRIPAGTKVADFDNPKSTLGQNTKFKIIGNNTIQEAVEFLDQPQGIFSSILLKVTDKSIFQPNKNDSSSAQLGFRRTDLLPAYNAATIEKGKKTYHHSFQLMQQLNISHGYLLGSLEYVEADGAHVFDLFHGSDFDSKDTSGKPLPNEQVARSFRVRDINFNTIFSAKAELKIIYNFAIEVDWDKKTLQVYFSTGNAPLKKVKESVPNVSKNPKASDPAGKCEWHLQLIKQPLPNPNDPEEKRGDIPHRGIQPSNIHEGIVQLRNFVEDTTTEPLDSNPDGPSNRHKRECNKGKRQETSG
ncbi:hypothetical protein O181_026462 [Austropuccinia psidii MF-1]|uniref:Glycoside hydrolase 131 catalytic N-terminal domain-containing protein n=1 Tax=Austropuccinia psidii MF-1 TaxID=1389203 RepID=A0A9Q3H0T3_9BASI|nr:hypothetical protein [Austropuccinia psidii MF-1]